MAAMRSYGVPVDVLSDNGKQVTGRFGSPRPAKLLFERICRENGITHPADQAAFADDHGKDESRSACRTRTTRHPAVQDLR